jgi:hypothetical protein
LPSDAADPLRLRLATQLDSLGFIVAGAGEDALSRRPPSGKWSALENLAHVARHHELFLERIETMLAEDEPSLPRYRAEDDPEWPQWAALPAEEVLVLLRALRKELVGRFELLGPGELARIGIHSRLGPMSLRDWTQFFLIHEAHHLYVALVLLRNPVL